MAEAPTPASHRKKVEIDGPEEAPPAKPLTLVLFYLLVAGTVGMLVWALTSIIG